MKWGICPQCQSVCPVSDDGKYCLTHNVANSAVFPECLGSVNTEPETVFEDLKKKRQVHKITLEQLAHLLDGIYIPTTSNYFRGSWEEKFIEGKVSLSVKIGKRRRFVNGRMICDGYESSQISSGYDILRFVPNNLEKMRSVITASKLFRKL